MHCMWRIGRDRTERHRFKSKFTLWKSFTNQRIRTSDPQLLKQLFYHLSHDVSIYFCSLIPRKIPCIAVVVDCSWVCTIHKFCVLYNIFRIVQYFAYCTIFCVLYNILRIAQYFAYRTIFCVSQYSQNANMIHCCTLS